MSYWGSFPGRWSPFGARPPYPPPEVRDNDYHYISEADIVDPPSAYQPDYYGRRRPRPDDGEEPDVIILKHRGITYPLHFEAFSIGEDLRVGAIRRAAAEATQARDPRRLTLLYKGKQLKDDGVFAKHEGLKQNSELMCVVSEASVNGGYSSDDGESVTEAELRDADRDGGVRTDTRDGPRRPFNKTKRPKPTKNPEQSRDDYNGEHTSRTSSNSNLRPTPSASARKHSPSPGPRPFDSSLPSNVPTGPGSTALKQIADLENKYRSELASPVEKLLKNPPSDAKTRDYEVIKLIETLERDYLLKTDAIETEGVENVRNKRKALVRMLQSDLSQLDAAKKRWKSSI